jgi:hypothetical protein
MYACVCMCMYVYVCAYVHVTVNNNVTVDHTLTPFVTVDGSFNFKALLGRGGGSWS